VEIVRILEAAHASLTSSGAPVALGGVPQERASASATGDVHDFTLAQAVRGRSRRNGSAAA
jgi:hypothetical protein